MDPDPAKSALARRFGADVVDLRAGEEVLQIAERVFLGAGNGRGSDHGGDRQQRTRQHRRRGCAASAGESC